MNGAPIILLRIGIASAFLYAGIASLSDPSSWVGFVPLWAKMLVNTVMPLSLFMKLFSVGEICLALWLLVGWRVSFPAWIAAALLAGITLANIGAIDIVFRDIGLSFAAAALAVLSSQRA